MRNRILCIIAILVLCAALAGGCAWASDDEKGLTNCSTHMNTLVQAIELWANDHRGNFPTKEEFSSPRFLEYVKKVKGGFAKKEVCCPVSARPYLYQSLPLQKSYVIKCPTPEMHGLASFYYSRDKMFVKGKKVPVAKKPSGTSPVAAAAPTPAATVSAKPSPSPSAKVSAKPTPSPTASPAAVKKPGKTESPEHQDVLKEDREKIITVITALYNAYSEKNLDKIMELEKESIEASATDYEKKGKGPAQEVREAFKSATKEIIEHKDFKMLPLNMSDLTFQKRGKFVKVTSVVPIIATERLEVMEEGKYFFVRLRIGELVFDQRSDGWKIVNMYLY
ncbi:MAG: hypothetical protein RDV48_03585 [Candidatus Eremiobacteraeota bacterium]|nr:hypothetical protein [Candidatus Eremiobacteraeota bacterium]